MKVKAMRGVFLLFLLAVALPTAYSQCPVGLIRVCTGVLVPVCICVLPGGGSADPILRDFVGNKFEFFGEPHSFYNLYSDNAHQVNMKLFPGFVDGHNGSYMGEFGIAFHDYRVRVSLVGDGDIRAEAWQEQPLELAKPTHNILASGEARYTVVGRKEGDTLSISTEPFRAFHGRTVDILSGTLEVNVWSVPAGTMDSHNVSQPAYLNFNLTLLAPPAGDVAEGIIGESLEKAVQLHNERTANLFAESLQLQDAAETKVGTFDGKGLTNDYRVSSLFGTDFDFNKFGEKKSSKAVARRSLISSRFAALILPISSTSA